MSRAWASFAPRSITPRGVHAVAGWRLKAYEVNAQPEFQWTSVAAGLALAQAALPQPPTAAGRPGLGVIIAHVGASHTYLVLAWWDSQNEMFTRAFATPAGQDAWVAGEDRYSFCVWDLEILWFERNAWIDCMLSGRPPREDDYLAVQLSRPIIAVTK